MAGGYELHQKLRTKAVRQLKKKDYDGAVASLYDGAQQLLVDKEQGSGCDLACYLLDVYQQAGMQSTEESRKRIVDLVALAAPDFWRKKVMDAAVKWSTAVTNTPAGDGYLRLAFGDLLAKGGDYHAAEAHYIAACSPPPAMANSDLYPQHAPKAFACMMLDWLAQYGQAAAKEHGSGQAEAYERIGSGHFALRALIPLLLARSLTSSRAFLSIFISRLTQRHQSMLLPVQPNPKAYVPPANLPKPSGDALMLYAVANPELNFAQMTLVLATVAVEHKKRTQGARVPDNLRQSWAAAVQQFEKETDEDEWIDSTLPDLSKIYFDIAPPRGGGGNFMQEMLGSLMGGGSAGESGKTTQPVTIRHAPPPALPSSPAVDAGPGASDGDAVAGGSEGLDLD